MRLELFAMNNMSNAFHAVCTDAVKPNGKWYVVLWEHVASYGGPEEGGWYNHSAFVQAYKCFTNEEAAQMALQEVQKMAEELTKAQSRIEGQACLDSLEWLEARGLDADFLPDPDRSDYSVSIQDTPPESRDAQGMRWGDYEG
jgi:hypothetical protein